MIEFESNILFFVLLYFVPLFLISCLLLHEESFLLFYFSFFIF